jgi:hypothetical protein
LAALLLAQLLLLFLLRRPPLLLLLLLGHRIALALLLALASPCCFFLRALHSCWSSSQQLCQPGPTHQRVSPHPGHWVRGPGCRRHR